MYVAKHVIKPIKIFCFVCNSTNVTIFLVSASEQTHNNTRGQIWSQIVVECLSDMLFRRLTEL